MSELSAEVQTFVVTLLARYSSPRRVVELVKDAYGIELTRQQVHHYNPERPGGPEKWVKLFKRERRKYERETERKAVAHAGFRLGELQELYLRTRDSGNVALAADLLEQAAKESGGAFTNRQVLAGDKDAPVAVEFYTLHPGPLAGGKDTGE